jgi:succinate dehydrogenase / fumarate reductase, cytochrome b subunit
MSVATTTKSAEPVSSSAVRLALLWQNSVGKKALMALTGIILSLFVLGHLVGNLQVFQGAEKLNAYAKFLQANQGLLWIARIVLLASVGTHAIAGILVTLEKQRARPIAYYTKGNVQATVASRTMIWSGLLILAFVIYHLLHLTFGTVHPSFRPLAAYENVVNGFRVTGAAVAYIVSMVGVGFHLWHGLYSMTQSLGFRHPRYTPTIRSLAALIATLLALGNISIPFAVLTGIIG